ncbi:hypothetical protein [Corynebacterium macclintockiae]|uniref:hypothetical protein n=1 Tax=Corynebacterium macclintockiae TaxID=2913501 RepID=UPI003EC00FD9
MKRFATAAVATATALSLAAAPAQAAPSTPTDAQKIEAAKLVGMFALRGTGAAPNTKTTGEMAAGSIMSGSSAETASAQHSSVGLSPGSPWLQQASA